MSPDGCWKFEREWVVTMSRKEFDLKLNLHGKKDRFGFLTGFLSEQKLLTVCYGR